MTRNFTLRFLMNRLENIFIKSSRKYDYDFTYIESYFSKQHSMCTKSAFAHHA